MRCVNRCTSYWKLPTSYWKLSIVLLLFTSVSAKGADDTTALVKKMQEMPSARVSGIADSYAKKNDTDVALALYSVVYSRATDGMTEKELNECAYARLKAGRIYYDQGSYAAALEMFVAGVEISEQCADRPLHLARLYNNIGNVYCIYLEYEKGIDYYLKALECCRKMPDRNTEHDIALNAAGISAFIDRMDDAKKFYSMSEKTKDPEDPEDIYMSGYTLSLMQIHEKNYAPAVNRLMGLARFAAEKKMHPRYECFAYQDLSNAYLGLGKMDSTLKYLRLCYSTAERNNLQHTFIDVLRSLSKFYENEGDVTSANKYMKQYLSIKDSVYNMREFDVVKNTLLSYEVNKTSREIDNLRMREAAKLQTIRVQRSLMLAAGILLLVITASLTMVLRQKRKINRNYAALYAVNRDFIANQESLTARLRESHEALREKEKEIQALRAELGKGSPEESDVEKYRTSNLSDDKRKDLADKIQNVMENTLEFCDCDFSLDTLASLVESNSKYVSQVINDSFGKNFFNYINPYRIHLVCRRLNDVENYGHYTLRAIALGVGFKSYTSFVNIFKKIIGITPSLYQKMALQGEKQVTA